MAKSKSNKHTLFRIFWILLVVIITGYLYTIYKPYLSTPVHLRHFDTVSHAKFKPSGDVGQGLGFIGALLMILCVVLYILRKKIEKLECLGPLSLWLEIHIFLGILGPIFIIFHSALKVTLSVNHIGQSPDPYFAPVQIHHKLCCSHILSEALIGLIGD